MSNYAAPPQRVEPVPYRDLDETHTFARRWRDEHRGQWFTTAKLSGFCVLLKRAVYDIIGGLDERFGLGLFDDDDLAVRARRAGFDLAVAHDLFIHHFGSRTFAGNGIDTERLLDENAQRFAAKWGHDAPVGRRITLQSWRETAHPAGRDIMPSSRNVALDRATGDYVFWLDADDVIEPPERQKLLGLLGGLRTGDESAYVVRCACDPGADGSGGETVVDHIRLFPRRPDVRWTYRVHEQILPSLRRANIPVRWTDLVVRHTGCVDVALRTRKLERDIRILLEQLKDQPDDPLTHFNLGAIAIERHNWGEALGYLRKSLRFSAPTDSLTRKLFALIARAHQMLNDTGSAIRVCAEGLALDPEDAELWFRKAVVHRQRGESAEAAECWRTILGLSRPEKFASVDMGIYGHLTRRNLAVLAAESGDWEEESRLWRAVLAECPGDREALARLNRAAMNGQGPTL